jgi:hypothetical protein
LDIADTETLTQASGMDIFLSRVSPSKQFDALSEDFPTMLLYSALAGLFAVAAFIKHYQQRSMLKKLWA